MDAFSYILNHVFIQLRPSNISGIGVFAMRDIPQNTKIFEVWTGETGFYPISQSQLNQLDDEVRRHVKDMFVFSTDFPSDTNIYIKLTHGYHWIHLNPYCFINSGFYEDKVNLERETAKTTKNVKKGEEILGDYIRYEKIEKKLF